MGRGTGRAGARCTDLAKTLIKLGEMMVGLGVTQCGVFRMTAPLYYIRASQVSRDPKLILAWLPASPILSVVVEQGSPHDCELCWVRLMGGICMGNVHINVICT